MMNKTIRNSGIALLLLILCGCSVSGVHTGSVSRYRVRNGSVETVHYYSYKYLRALHDSAVKHNNKLPGLFIHRLRMPKDIQDSIVSGHFPKGGYLYLNLNADGPEDFEKYKCELAGKNDSVFMKHSFKSQYLHNKGGSIEKTIDYTSPRYNGRNLGQPYTLTIKESYAEWFGVPSDSVITAPFTVKIYNSRKNNTLYRSYYIKTDSRKFNISYDGSFRPH